MTIITACLKVATRNCPRKIRWILKQVYFMCNNYVSGLASLGLDSSQD
jgi:hypothetical protein